METYTREVVVFNSRLLLGLPGSRLNVYARTLWVWSAVSYNCDARALIVYARIPLDVVRILLTTAGRTIAYVVGFIIYVRYQSYTRRNGPVPKTNLVNSAMTLMV